MHVLSFHIILSCLSIVLIAGCSADPGPGVVPVSTKSVVLSSAPIEMLGQNGEVGVFDCVWITADGEAFAGGIEMRTDGSGVQGNLWSFDGGAWKSALDPAARNSVMHVHGVHGVPSGSVWAVAFLKNAIQSRYVAVLHREDSIWVDRSPDDVPIIDKCCVVSDEHVWLYGLNQRLPLYLNGTWQSTALPEPWYSMNRSAVRVTSFAASESRAYALVEIGSGQNIAGRILFSFEDNTWQPVYREGQMEGADATDRKLKAIAMTRDGTLYAVSAGVYRWTGTSFEHVRSSPHGYTLNCIAIAPNGTMIATGYLGVAVLFDGNEWKDLTLNYTRQPTIRKIAINDSVLVCTGNISFDEVLLRGRYAGP